MLISQVSSSHVEFLNTPEHHGVFKNSPRSCDFQGIQDYGGLKNGKSRV